jgi:hypothetical protein
VFAGGVLGPVAFGLTAEVTSFTIAWLLSAAGALLAATSVAAATRLLPAHGVGQRTQATKSRQTTRPWSTSSTS